jgi:hypothetical protein
VPPAGVVLRTSAATRLPLTPPSFLQGNALTPPSASLAPIKGSSTIPARAHRPAGPPLPPPRWTRTSARFHRRPSPRAPSLGSSRAPKAACSPALHLPSLESEPRRERHRGLAVTARRHHLQPRHHPQSIHGESNRPPVPFVHLHRLPFAASKLAPLPRARLWIPKGICVNQGPVLDDL